MFLSMDELFALDRGPQAKHGNAEYIASNNTIRLYVYSHKRFYEVDLDNCTTSRQALDWILHVSEKKWCTGDTLKNFIKCLNDACQLREGKTAFAYFGIAGALGTKAKSQ